jgi:subtilisin family serine protease
MADNFSSTDARPFLPFASGPKNRLRQRVRGGGAKPRESAAAHGRNLLQQVEDFQRLVDEQAGKRATDLPPLPDDHQVIIEANKLLPEQVRSLGLNLVEERTDGLLVTISPEVTLPLLATKANSYVTETTDSGNPRYGGVIAPIEKIRPASREDKMGASLAALIEAGQLDPAAPMWVDIELAGGEGEGGTENRQEFYDYLNNFSPDLSPYAAEAVTATGHFLIETDYSLHRVYLPGRAVLDLLDDSRANWVLSIDVVAVETDRTIPLPSTAGGQLPMLPELPAQAPRVVIIDSGIAADHPFFRDAGDRTIIGRQRNFLPAGVEPEDFTEDELAQGHGTALASVAAYGSLDRISLEPEAAGRPVVWIENAKVLLPAAKVQSDGRPNTPQFHLTQFPKSLMRDVVTAFHGPLPQHCKLFSLGLAGVLHPLSKISNWAEELDNLAAQHDLLFVIPTGNVQPAEIASLMAATGQGYPHYLLDPQARLRDPGQAYNALTVGALASPPAAPTAPWQGGTPLAPAGHPAPFTRSGLLQYGPLKPDVVEFGGNLSQNGSHLAAIPEAAVLVANRDYAAGQANQPLGFHVGTGLAAARVTHLAGRIQAQYPTASANLIRALIVNSAEWPEPFRQSLVANPEDQLSREARAVMLRLCGYGAPQPDKALSSNAHCMVFVAEDSFSWTKEEKNSSGRYPAKVSFFAVRLEPDDLYGLPPATKVRVSVTLAYNPAVRKTQRRRYQAVDLRWVLRRREEPSEAFQARWMAEANFDEEETDDEVASPQLKPWPWQLKPVLNPGGRVRRGSLIRDWFDTYAHELPGTLELVVVAMVAPWRRPPAPLTQPFALVVSIEALDPDLRIYDSVRVLGGGEAEG